MLVVALGLTAAVCWGSYDYLGGVSSRRLPVVWVLTVTQGVVLVGSAAAVLVEGAEFPELRHVAPAFVAGSAYALALLAFFRAVAVARMGIVAAITAGGAVIPVLVGIAGGEDPGVAGFAGIALALGGVLLLCVTSSDEDSTGIARRTGVALGLVAALGTGLYYVGIDRTAAQSVPWTLLVVSTTAFVVLAVTAVVRKPAGTRWPLGLVHLTLIGGLALAGNFAYALATTLGELAVVAVLASLHPAVTTLLAWLLLGERLRRTQQVGVAAALFGVALVAS